MQEPWAHGTVVRATRYPDYYDLNTIRVEDDPGMSADELAAFADEVQAELAHRRFDFERPSWPSRSAGASRSSAG